MTVRFSVIVPTYRRPERLRDALEGVAALAYPREGFEVLVVDDGSGDETEAVVRTIDPRLDLRYLPQPVRRGPATARNIGAMHARGEMLAFLDDDCIPSRDWLGSLDAAARRRGDTRIAFGGRTVSAHTNTLFGTASQSLVDFLYDWYNTDGERASFFTTNNFACSRASFTEIGGFDERFRAAAAEDRDFCDRWTERGWRLVFVPEAEVHHAQRTSLGEFLSQQAGYGRGAVDLHLARDRRGVARPRLEPLSFYARLLTHAVGRESPARAAALVALAAASQGAYAWGYFAERWRRRASDAHHALPTAATGAVPQSPEH